jgi:biotin carboxyl carrier protein
MHNLALTPHWILKWGKIVFWYLSVVLLCLFLPWQQFSSGEGRVVGWDPNDRFQEIHAPVSGFIRQWYVREGSWVEKGEALVSLSDTDADLIERLIWEKTAAEEALTSAKFGLKIAKLNESRQKKLYEQGLAARKDWEKEKIGVSKLEMEVSKSQAVLAKAQREVARQRTQKVIAPRAGWVVRVQSGEGGQIVKQGDALLVFAPKTDQLAAEIWVSGDDVALIKEGDPARLEFSGWPAIQAPGWPSIAIGTFKAEVVLVDAMASQKGKFRVLLAPAEKWPSQIFVRQGARASGFINIGTVSLGWELWRQFNGMPAETAPVQDELSALLNFKKSFSNSKSDKKEEK